MENVEERGQQRPAYWPKDSTTEDFRGTKWTQLTWQPMAESSHFADTRTGSSVSVKRGDTQLAIFKIKGRYYATQQMCPHKRTFALSEGLIGDDMASLKLWVSCPYHKKNFTLNGVDAGTCTNDSELSIAAFEAEEREGGWVFVKLPPVDELDSRLGTGRWMVRKGEAQEPFTRLDEKLKGLKGRKPSRASHLAGGGGEDGAVRNTVGGQDGMDW